FGRTLATGISRFESLVSELSARGETVIPGTEAFRLYDTYGFPYELTEELARDAGLTVDREGFERAMERQREQSRASAAVFADTGRTRAGLYVQLAGGSTAFLGYDTTEASGTVVGIVVGDAATETAEAGERVEILLDRTPFYGEAGGQVGDTGTIQTDTGVVAVEDTQRPSPDIIVHRGTVREGFIRTGQTAQAQVDAERRADIRRNHTATHLLHAALRRIVGEHVQQAGSLVAPDRLRFDFTSLEPLGPAVLRQVQELVNQQILKDLAVQTEILPYQQAVAAGAIALFGEKYGETVRVVTVPGFSKELCGGTHVAHTGEIGLFVITDETSVASGVRRVEALTGRASVQHALQLQETVQRLVRDLHAPPEALPEQVAVLQERLRERERELERLRGKLISALAAELAAQAVAVDGARVLATRVEAPSRDILLQMADRLRDTLASGVVVLGAVIDDRPAVLAMVTRDLVQRGVDAGKLIREITPVIGGRGGGRPELAQGGGTDASRLDAALASARSIVERQLAG
ncbi:MAG: alanine--tRNA ligase-related protein, partial [Sphaerobacter sp.]|nr:alanine--tRNA ligase-related protein [Sphaerobacter sp.]